MNEFLNSVGGRSSDSTKPSELLKKSISSINSHTILTYLLFGLLISFSLVTFCLRFKHFPKIKVK